MLVVLGILGCGSEPTEPESRAPSSPTGPRPGLVVSSPVDQASGTTLAYVSAAPGSLPRGDLVSVRNLSEVGNISTAVVDGGFDPVPVGAGVGEPLQIVTTDSAGNAATTKVIVAARAPVRVVRVRTGPPRTDVPLNARIEVVFSAPVDRESAERGIRVTRNGSPIAGTVSAGDASSLTMVFEPNELLAPSTSYRVEVTADVEGQGGVPLADPVVVEFQTAGAASTNSPPVAGFVVGCNGLACTFDDRSSDPDAGDNITSRAWALGDGSTVRDVTSPVHTYGASGTFTVMLTVTDRHGGADSASQRVTVGSAPTPAPAPAPTPMRTGTYERSTPHAAPGRHTRFVIQAGGTFEYHDESPAGRVVRTGQWAVSENLLGQFVFRFDSEQAAVLGTFLTASAIGFAYTGQVIVQGFEEGVYSAQPVTVPSSLPPVAGQIAFVRDGRIHTASTQGGAPLQLTTGPDDAEPAWSPDGSMIAFRRIGGAAPGIYVMDANGANPVLRTSEDWVEASPSWSSDGAWVGFSCSRPGAVVFEAAMCKVRATGSDTARVLEYSPGRGQFHHPSWSPDGTRIAYTSDWNAFDFVFEIWTVMSDGSGARALRNGWGLEQYQAAWSPDGSRIALIECSWAAVSCSSSVIAVMNADGSNLVRLITASGFARPSWSPDGQLIAFGTGTDIAWISPDGQQRGRIVANGHSPAWRP